MPTIHNIIAQRLVSRLAWIVVGILFDMTEPGDYLDLSFRVMSS